MPDAGPGVSDYEQIMSASAGEDVLYAAYRIDRVVVQVVVARHDPYGRKIGEMVCRPQLLFEPLAENLQGLVVDALRAARLQHESEEA